jgi:hypothetical protein
MGFSPVDGFTRLLLSSPFLRPDEEQKIIYRDITGLKTILRKRDVDILIETKGTSSAAGMKRMTSGKAVHLREEDHAA